MWISTNMYLPMPNMNVLNLWGEIDRKPQKIWLPNVPYILNMYFGWKTFISRGLNLITLSLFLYDFSYVYHKTQSLID